MSGFSKAKTAVIILIPFIVTLIFSLGAVYVGTLAQAVAK